MTGRPVTANPLPTLPFLSHPELCSWRVKKLTVAACPQVIVCAHPGCSFSASLAGHVARHFRVHSQERPFLCEVRRFSNRSRCHYLCP